MKYFWLLILIFIPAAVFADIEDITAEIPSPSPCATGLAFDGKAIWIADRKTDYIYKIDKKTGETLDSFKGPGYFMTGLAWDGEYLWVSDMDFTNTATESYSGKIYKLDPKTGRTLKVIVPPSSDPQGLAWDGEYLWVSDNGTDMLYKISPDDGTTIASFKSPSRDPRGMTWDGEYLWVADRSHDEVYRVDPKSGRVIMILKTSGPYPWGLAWGDKELLISDYQTDRIYTMAVFGDSKYTRADERHSSIEFTHDIINFGPANVENLKVYIAIPENLSSQDIISIAYPQKPSGFEKDKWGQEVALFDVKKLAAQERYVSVMKVEANIYSVMYHIFPEKVGKLKDMPGEVSRFLDNDDKYRMNDPVIQKAVKEAVGEEENPYWIARNIFDYLRDKLFYERIGGWDIAPTILKRGSGSCSEYAFLYIAMCRAAGVPARYAGSVVVRGEDASFDFVYHRWVEIYLPGYEWIPVDPSRGDKEWPRDQALSFGYLSNHFLITTHGGGGSEYLGWDYNSSESYEADGPVQLRVERIGEWDPAGEKSE